jgi:hypothetical protein
MFAGTSHFVPAADWSGMKPGHDNRRTCAVRLIDRRTGQPHKINGTALTIYTRAPDEAAADLLSGRDAAVWEIRIDTLDPVETRS